jgi:hypothetical protein
MSTSTIESAFGQSAINNQLGGWNESSFVIGQAISLLQTAMPVIVKSVDAIGLNPVGFVSIQPAIDQMVADGSNEPHGIITNVPYFRLQGGNNAVIIDPAVNDIGIALFSSRDISLVKANRAAAPAGSMRRYDFSDALYIGGILNGTPTQYIKFDSSGIAIFSPTAVNITAPAVNIGASSETLLALVTQAFESLYNSHTHSGGGSGTPVTPMTSSHLTSAIKGG